MNHDSSIKVASGPRPVFHQSWRRIVFLHWEVPVDALAPLIPAGLELDTYHGRAYIGLVPFTMARVRPAGFPSLPWISYFHETNVRTYVRRPGHDPGVWFFSLDAANPIGAALGRRAFGLPYHWAAMELRESEREGIRSLEFRSHRRTGLGREARCLVDTEIDLREPSRRAEPGSLEEFLIERYLLFSMRRGRCFAGRVRHAPYSIRDARVLALEESLIAAIGIDKRSVPALAHAVEDVDVDVIPLISAD
ncbi:MAG: DUF2071 domain-containing protein [Isosphaeraceae bacterium]|nr:DUF2071 domain-containing protein [Isosphaeraceae bacterium]